MLLVAEKLASGGLGNAGFIIAGVVIAILVSCYRFFGARSDKGGNIVLLLLLAVAAVLIFIGRESLSLIQQ